MPRHPSDISHHRLRAGRELTAKPSSIGQIIPPTMPTFQSKKYIPSSQGNSIAARYRVALSRHPFLLFGLPFIATMVAGSFFLTPATALRYERHDRKVKQMSKEEELGIGKDRRKFDMREEYYVSGLATLSGNLEALDTCILGGCCYAW